MMLHICNPNIWETKVGASWIQVKSRIHLQRRICSANQGREGGINEPKCYGIHRVCNLALRV